MSLQITTKLVKESRINSFDFNNIVFGRVFTDHNFICDYSNGEWKNPRIEPFGKISLSPSLSALHYGQSIFEGMKAFKSTEGEVALFRPLENHKRMNHSAKRMCMPQIPEEIFIGGLQKLLELDHNWIPSKKGAALYIRPFMFATDDFLGVKQSDTYTFIIYACPVDSYYSNHLKVKIEEHYTRAAAGGVGAAKCAGNYAASMYPTKLAQEAGYNQVLWTDGIEHKYLEETGTSNVFILCGKKVYTPSLTDTLLAGITRNSVITLLKDQGFEVVEKQISIDELTAWHESGELTEMFVTGTAATITNIELFGLKGKDYKLNMSKELVSLKMKAILNDIRSLNAPDTFNWMLKVPVDSLQEA
ncbi:MAG: branched-chain amino acid aminotransferase [Bacteroidia bacterium]|nr:branched-chain amino acid aminotransferase [Bacteroidia bacterium]